VTACGPTANVGAGTHHITTPADGPWAVDSLTVGTAPGSTAMTGRAVRIVDWGSQHRVLGITTGPSTVLATTENFNTGWRARLHGSTLEPIRVDGWRQAWVVPAGAAGQVDLTYTPDRTYRAGLLLGALGVLVVFLLAVLRPRSAGLPAARGWSARSGVSVVLGVGTAALLAGWAAVVIVPVAILCPRRRRPVLAGASYALGGLVAFVQPGRLPGSGSGVFGAPVQVLAVLAVVAVLFAVGDEQHVTPEPTPG